MLEIVEPESDDLHIWYCFASWTIWDVGICSSKDLVNKSGSAIDMLCGLEHIFIHLWLPIELNTYIIKSLRELLKPQYGNKHTFASRIK